MAKLNEEEAAQLAALQEKAEAPEEDAGGGLSRVLNISIDLGDDKQVALGRKMGLLTAEDLEDDGGDDDDGDDGKGGKGGKGEDGPRRAGFFGDDD